MSELAAGREELAAITGLETGRVRLGAMQALGRLDLPGAIARFHREHPAIEITLSEDSTAHMQQLVLDGRLDLAIAALDVAVSDDLSARVLVTEAVLVALPRLHPLASRSAIELGLLRDDRFVLFRPGTGLRTITERAAHEAGFSPRVALETGNLDRLIALVNEGLGVSLVPESTVRHAPPGVRAVPLSRPLIRTVGLLSRPDRWLSPSARTLRDLLVDTARPAT
jgi:DNA-binding transcriptional LysR family regulator